jgi:hypothetical protein
VQRPERDPALRRRHPKGSLVNTPVDRLPAGNPCSSTAKSAFRGGDVPDGPLVNQPAPGGVAAMCAGDKDTGIRWLSPEEAAFGTLDKLFPSSGSTGQPAPKPVTNPFVVPGFVGVTVTQAQQQAQDPIAALISGGMSEPGQRPPVLDPTTLSQRCAAVC